MFPRSGLSIRRLISQRKDRSYEEDQDFPPFPPSSAFEHEDLAHARALATKQQRTRSWVPSRQTKKTPKPIIIVRHSEDIDRIKRGLPPLDPRDHSSASSLYSCDYDEFDLTRPRPSPKRPGSSGSTRSPARSPGLCPPTPPPSKDRQGSRPRSSPGVSEDSRRARSSSFPVRHNPREQMITPPSSANSSFDFERLLLPDPEYASASKHWPMPPPPSLPTPPPDAASETPGYSENLARFSRETEEAFNLESPVLGPLSTRRMLPAKDVPQAALRNSAAPLSRSKSRKGSISSPKTPTRTPSRSSSVKKARRKTKKPRMRPQPIIQKLNASRWTLPENARDLFTVRIFQRIEVDEMLPESRLEEIRGNVKSQPALAPPQRHSGATSSSETDTSCDTPVEPFHLEGLPSRIGAAGVPLNIPSPVEEVPTPRCFEFDHAIDTALETHDSLAAKDESEVEITGRPAPLEVPAVKTASPMSYKNLTFPSPPAKNPARYAQRKAQPPAEKQLPTIPEVIVTSPERPSSVQTLPAPSNDFIYLPGTSFTMICPTNRQGPIRLTRADLSIEALTAAIDESLDWTAFHMAILGGAGDFFGESTDYSRPSDDDVTEVEDLVDWFEGFEFDSPGKLIDAEEAAVMAMSTPSSMPSMRYSATSFNSSPGTVGSGRTPPLTAPRKRAFMLPELPIPVGSEHPSGFWNAAQDARVDRFYADQTAGVKRWPGEGHPKRPRNVETGSLLTTESAGNGDEDRRRPSADSNTSMPQSPMLELVVSRDVDGNEYVVPMGFNLGHDLGDYLRWENDVVFCGGYINDEY
ncbi:hypothetical protein GQ53DRAFT_310446 [Thozetella sp. PMI_491]|nr:hypothetical protein GQ53DRAFT_310446 [Thozetella sp. PMI_491]